ncbi:hypothetical protein PISMIDRAFT_675517 [Pisolithus microcarpus 441]|uniref:Uncharacterized protein n=1 Tax=Pisolithus microcarpus 441 TaxID=765257 RepID=A0A0D0A3L1_9AGAM|nr:hypothetical protein PISMIDRAFT_675517 [Pisolithus microcarpus 441]
MGCGQVEGLENHFSSILEFLGVICRTSSIRKCLQKSALLDEACSDAFTYRILFEGIIFIVSDDNSHATKNSFPIRPRVDMWREYDVPLIE